MTILNDQSDTKQFGTSFLAGLERTIFGNRPKRLPYDILVIGDSGTGKTSLVTNLLKGRRTGGWPTRVETTRSVEKNRASINNVRFHVLDTPGQEQFFHILENDALALVGTGEIGGIIVVTCWGHHETLRTSSTGANSAQLTQWPPYLEDGTINLARADYYRESEMDFLRKWTSQLPIGAQVRWLMTVVNKADLLPGEGRSVTSYYDKPNVFATTLLRPFPQGIKYKVSLASANPGLYYGVHPNCQKNYNDIAHSLNRQFTDDLFKWLELDLEEP